MRNLSVVRRFTASVLMAVIGLPSAFSAQTHVVSPADLQKEMLTATGKRQRNVETIRHLLSSDKVQSALAGAGVNPAQLESAISSLDDKDLARLAARADKAQADFAAGRISDRDLLWILLAVAVLILIIVAV